METNTLPLTLDLENATFTQKEINDFEIDIKIKIDVPQKLYKYYSLSDYSLKGLKNNTLYFSHANLLNDVMDGNFMLWDMEDFITQYKKDRKINSDNDQELTIIGINQISKPILECRGILSLCGTYKNELIWAHYTNETGYCIELDTKDLKESLNDSHKSENCHFFPVSYNTLKQIDFFKYSHSKTRENKKNVSAILPLLYCFAQKDNCWKYENEWRFLLRDRKFNSISFPLEIINDEDKSQEDDRKIGGNIEINKDVISKVILAPLFFNNSRFNKEESNSDCFIYNVKNNNEGKNAKDFLDILKKSFGNKIYQVDKIIINKHVCREIKYKIEITDIGENFIKLIKKIEKNI
ncbi:DUF2971 domain-containing protein [Aquirufa nivalisilvae]